MLRTAHAEGDSRPARLAALRKRHEEIAIKIDEAHVHHKSISDFYIAELKRQKLHLKDMIEELAGRPQDSGDVVRA